MYGNKKNPSLTRNVEIPLSYFMLLRKNIHQGQRIKYSENTLRYGGRSIRILFLSPNSNFCHSLFTNFRWGLNGEFGPTLRLKENDLIHTCICLKWLVTTSSFKVKYPKLMRLINIYENTILVAHQLFCNIWGKGCTMENH